MDRFYRTRPSRGGSPAGSAPEPGIGYTRRVRHPFFTSDRPLVFAHRGGAALAPENTIAAFDNAARLGADGLELDVRLSRDGIVVVHHDRTLERTTGLHGDVAARTGADLSDAGVPT